MCSLSYGQDVDAAVAITASDQGGMHWEAGGSINCITVRPGLLLDKQDDSSLSNKVYSATLATASYVKHIACSASSELAHHAPVPRHQNQTPSTQALCADLTAASFTFTGAVGGEAGAGCGSSEAGSSCQRARHLVA